MTRLTIGLRKQVTPTPSDTAPISGGPFQGLLIRVAGIVKVKCADDDDFYQYAEGELAQGVWHPMQVTHVHTDTTAQITLGRNVS